MSLGLLLVGAVLAAYGAVRSCTHVPDRPDAAGGSPAIAAQAPGPDPSARLAAALNAYPRAGTVRLSVAVADYTTGVRAAFQPEQTYETASIVKVEVLATLLLQAQDTNRALTATERTLAQEMIVHSDNDVTDTLWRSVGGAAAITTAIRRLGLTTAVPDWEAWGESTTTAEDQLRILQVLLQDGGPLDTGSVAQARALMGAVAGDQHWGVSAAAAAGETTYLKNGWVTRDADDRWIVHSIGEIEAPGRAVGIVVLSDGHASLQSGIDLVEDVARLARGCLDS